MSAPETRPPLTLSIHRTLRQPPAKVFAAWTQAEAMKRWFAPTDEYRVEVPEQDFRVGGRCRLEMHHVRGNVNVLLMTYVEITPPSKLVFTMRWENNPAAGETLLTVECKPAGTGTELSLFQERFPDETSRDNHMNGWNGCLARLVAQD